MKITKKYLEELIKEELESALQEENSPVENLYSQISEMDVKLNSSFSNRMKTLADQIMVRFADDPETQVRQLEDILSKLKQIDSQFGMYGGIK